MTKQELFNKYGIGESHKTSGSIEAYYSVEIYRIANDGKLPSSDEKSVLYIVKFLDKKSNFEWWAKNVMVRPDFGQLYFSAKRLMYMFADNIISEINEQKS